MNFYVSDDEEEIVMQLLILHFT